MTSTNTLDSMQERNEQTLTDIQGLQSVEKELFNQLNSGLSDGTLTPEKKNDIITKINEISQMRVNLYKNMNSVSSFYSSNVASSNAVLAEQTIAVGIIEQELNEAKKRLTQLEDDSNQKMRMVQINNYYGDKYSTSVDILKSLLLFCIPILFFTVLFRAEVIPNTVYNVILIVILVWGVIYVGRKIVDASFRDNMNYQEYAWEFDKTTAPALDQTFSTQGNMDPWAATSSITCLGSNCCYDGTTYVESLNQCVPKDVATSLAASNASKFSKATETSTSGYSSNNASSGIQLRQGGYGGL
jgi:hypothetical protein